MYWLKTKKNYCFEVSSSLNSAQPQEDISRLDCDMQRKMILYDSRWQPAQWLDQEEAA